jgi:hypothetical protein
VPNGVAVPKALPPNAGAAEAGCAVPNILPDCVVAVPPKRP